MDPTTTTTVWHPIVQYGFAGFCMVLLAILVWLISRLLQILRETNIVIAANTQAIATLSQTASDTLGVCIEVKETLLSRPCIAKRSP